MTQVLWRADDAPDAACGGRAAGGPPARSAAAGWQRGRPAAALSRPSPQVHLLVRHYSSISWGFHISQGV